jgi:hypothetical protein
VDALQEALSARPEWGARRALLLKSKFPRFVLNSSRSYANCIFKDLVNDHFIFSIAAEFTHNARLASSPVPWNPTVCSGWNLWHASRL